VEVVVELLEQAAIKNEKPTTVKNLDGILKD
jgi:hypothetical protein